MSQIDPLPVRLARYEQMKAMQDAGKTLDEIGEVFRVSRQRVWQTLNKPPRKPGPPFGAGKVDALEKKLTWWQSRRDARIVRGQDTREADQRIAALISDIAHVTASSET